MTTTIGEAIQTVREANAALRGIARNGGRTAATTKAVARHTANIRKAEAALMSDRQTAIIGLLTEEAKLAKLADRLRLDPARVELKGRLELAQMDLRRFTRLIGNYELTETV